MLFGVMVKDFRDCARLEQIEAKIRASGRIDGQVVKRGPVFFSSLKPRKYFPEMGIHSLVFQDGVSGVWRGEIYNQAGFPVARNDPAKRTEMERGIARLFASLFASKDSTLIARLNARFAFAILDEERQEVILGRDHLGIETLFVYEDQLVYIFSTMIEPILECPGVTKELNYDALRRSLIFSNNPAWDTIFQGIRKVKPGSLCVLGAKGIIEKPYWHLSFKHVQEKEEPDIARELQELIADAVRVRLQCSLAPGIFISGGLDSSGVACFMRKSTESPISSFTYRTLQRSYDESAYARIIADYCKFDHHEVVFHPEDTRLIEMVVQMENEPFCNLGNTVSLFLLGCETRGLVSHIFTGTGGDELFAGHPVYSADKIAAITDRIPGILRSPAAALFRHLPDSNKKLDLTVKLKQFAKCMAYPKEFGTYRWRIYYGRDELNHLFDSSMAIDADHYQSLFSDVLAMYQEADGNDTLSRSLYVDFKTEVSFCLRRMDLIRNFGIEPMFPLLDYRLVECAATIPSSLKIKGYSGFKYIERPVLAGIIPDQILNRKDKLGLAIPMKNWLRSNPTVKGLVREVLSERNIKRRGLFKPAAIQTMWEDHQSARQNNSHRLWMLTVLELWLTANGL